MNQKLAARVQDLQSRVHDAYSQNPDGKLSLKHAVTIVSLMQEIVRELPSDDRKERVHV